MQTTAKICRECGNVIEGEPACDCIGNDGERWAWCHACMLDSETFATVDACDFHYPFSAADGRLRLA